ncbi:unnamed protein product [Lota lota]
MGSFALALTDSPYEWDGDAERSRVTAPFIEALECSALSRVVPAEFGKLREGDLRVTDMVLPHNVYVAW